MHSKQTTLKLDKNTLLTLKRVKPQGVSNDAFIRELIQGTEHLKKKLGDAEIELKEIRRQFADLALLQKRD